MTSAMTLIPYLLVAAYGLKIAWTRETYAADPRGRDKDVAVGALAAAYALAMIYAGGLEVPAAVRAALRAGNGPVRHGAARSRARMSSRRCRNEWCSG